MQQADDTTEAALAAGERTVTHTTRLGGQDVSAQVQSWTLERSYATDLPAAMRAFSGSSAAQLQLQVGGTVDRTDSTLYKTAPESYSPWADRATGDIARPGQSVVHEAGVGTATLPAFRGTLRNRSAASGTDAVQLTALDGAERLRAPAELPRPYTGLYWGRPVATATWCVDELLRQAGLLTSPPARAPKFVAGQPLSLIHATLHGGFATSYGTPEDLPDPRHYTWSRTGAPHEMALVPRGLPPGDSGVTVSWFPRSRVTVPGSRMLIEAWVNTAIGIGDSVRLELELNRTGNYTGTLSLDINFSKGTVTVWSLSTDPAVPGSGLTWSGNATAMKTQRGVWHIGAYVDVFTATNGQALPAFVPMLTGPDGATWTGVGGTFTATNGPQPVSELRKIRLVTTMATEGVQVTSGLTAAPTAAEFSQAGTWTKTAELDEAIMPLRTIPKVSGSQWDAIGQIAKASLSTAEIDERGRFKWRNFTRFATVPTTADLTLTSIRDIAALTVTEEIDACRNFCVQPAKDWSAVRTVSGDVVVDTAVRMIPRTGSLTISYTFGEDELDIGPPDTDDDSVETPGSSFRVAAQHAAGAPAVKGAVEAQIRREDGTIVLRLTNRTSQDLYTVTKTGEPSVRIVPIKPDRDPVERQAVSYVSGSDSERFYGRQEFYGDSSDWVQDLGAARQLADAMRAAGELPVPVLGDVQVLYDPRIQLGDVVRVQDTTGAVLDTLAWVVGITTTRAADGGVQQSLSLRGVSANGVPADADLTPDVPALPPVPDTSATYAAVAAAYPTLADLLAAKPTWGDV
ncbi:hypothetical protein [Streptomyces chiangmaiensis]|uniref:Tip attachment protein J domain-containing protein n=1 Tax=Streptomyces chiangmaiensis TaxID=766497 RepID=A0ABU7FGB5_9ACTN|nr:hypothetical protein [Streptomyces chiangmaiensis]MED7822970.1 hypothetical protein [Streptomyces chiangmaiensis]